MFTLSTHLYNCMVIVYTNESRYKYRYDDFSKCQDERGARQPGIKVVVTAIDNSYREVLRRSFECHL